MTEARNGITEHKTFCRTCYTNCGMVASVDENKQLVEIRPDKDDLHTKGYACFKGLIAPEAHRAENRVMGPLKRMPDGSFQRIGYQQALDEIAAKLKVIIERDGPEAVGGYRGSGAGMNGGASFVLDGLLGPIGTPKLFSAVTIDQSAKSVAVERIGYWPPGLQPFTGADVALVFGSNPIVSVSALNGFNPIKEIRKEIDKGLKLLVVDPRRTETARMAHMFMQPLPGEDSTILAGMIRMVFEKGWEDKEFVAKHASQVDALRKAVQPFTVEYVAKRADVPAETFVAITETFANAKRGKVQGGTGPAMSVHSNLTEHLISCLNIILGRFIREGEEIYNPGFITKRYEKRCQVIPAQRTYEKSYKSRLGDYGMIPGFVPEMATGIMADEILEPGPGQIRAFINHGGNPGVIVPDQLKVIRAFKSLELMVTVDPYMTATAKVSDYVLPTLLPYERSDFPCWQLEQSAGTYYSEGFTRYTPAISEPPPGCEVLNDGEVFWGLCKRLGLTFTCMGIAFDMTRPPTQDDLLRAVAKDAVMPFDEIVRHPMGVADPNGPQYALPGNPGPDDRFTLAPDDVVAEIKAMAGEKLVWDTIVANGNRATHRFSVRRQRDMWNSVGRELPGTKRRVPYNTARIHPDDLAELGIESGEMIRLSSEVTTVEIEAEADSTVRRGVVSMTHGYGTLPEENDYKRDGICANILITSDRSKIEAINAMPRMSSFAVHISPADRRNSPVSA